jgi:LruC domain-containing protein
MNISWSAVSGATLYYLYFHSEFQCADPQNHTGCPWYAVPGNPFSATGVTHYSLAGGTIYYYRIQAYKPAAQNWSGYDYDDGLTMPDEPENFQATSIGTTQITVEWDDVIGEDFYNMQAPGQNVQLDEDTVSFTKTGLTAGTQYSFRIEGENETAPGDYSELSVYTLPGPPTITNAVAQSQTSIKASWNQVTGGEDYHVYYRLYGGSTYTFAATVSAAPWEKTITGLQVGTRYQFAIKAENPDGNTSAYTNPPVSGWTLAAVPVITGATKGTDWATIQWSSASSTSHYIISRWSSAAGWEVVDDNVSYPATSWTDYDVVSGTQYKYKIKSANGGGTTIDSNEVTVWTLPATPTNLSVSGGCANSLTIGWTNPLPANKAILQVKNPFSPTWVDLQTYNSPLSSTISYTHQNLYYGKTYQYRVYLTNGNNEAGSTVTSAPTLVSTPPEVHYSTTTIGQATDQGEPVPYLQIDTYLSDKDNLPSTAATLDRVVIGSSADWSMANPVFDESGVVHGVPLDDGVHTTAARFQIVDSVGEDVHPPAAPQFSNPPTGNPIVESGQIGIGWGSVQDVGTDYAYFIKAVDECGLESDALKPDRTFDEFPSWYTFPECYQEDESTNWRPADSLYYVMDTQDHRPGSNGTQSITFDSLGFTEQGELFYVIDDGNLDLDADLSGADAYYVSAWVKCVYGVFEPNLAVQRSDDDVDHCSPYNGNWYTVESTSMLIDDYDWHMIGFVVETADLAGAEGVRIALDNELGYINTPYTYDVRWDDISLQPLTFATNKSGVDHYQVQFSTSNQPGLRDEGILLHEELVLTGESLQAGMDFQITEGAGNIYAHLRSVDRAGNASAWTTAGPWVYDKNPPNVTATITDIWSDGVLDSKYLRGNFTVEGTVPTTREPDEVEVFLYAVQRNSTGTPILVDSQILAQGVGTFSMTNSSSVDLDGDGDYAFFVRISDRFGSGVGNLGAPSPSVLRTVDNTPPSFGGLTRAEPDASGNLAMIDQATLVFPGATDALTPEADLFYSIYQTTGTASLNWTTDLLTSMTRSGLTTEEDDTETTCRLLLSALDRDATYQFGVRVTDLAGNMTADTTVRRIYGRGDYLLDWDIDGWETTLYSNFWPDAGTSATASMFVWGNGIVNRPGITGEWISFESPLEYIRIRPTGIKYKLLFVQLADQNGDVSFLEDLHEEYVEPVVPRAWDLRDSQTLESLTEGSRVLTSGESVEAELAIYDQLGNPISLTAQQLVVTVDHGAAIEVDGGPMSYAITGKLLGVATMRISAPEFSAFVDPLGAHFEVAQPGALAQIAISGPTIIPPGGSRSYTARGSDLAGNPLPISPLWNADSVGSINQNGNLWVVQTDDMIVGGLRVSDRTATDESGLPIAGSLDVTVDGRPPLVEWVNISPGNTDNDPVVDAASAATPLKLENQTLAIRISTDTALQENSLPATYEIHVDGLLFGTARQTAQEGPILSDTATFDPNALRSGTHELKVITRDGLGNTNEHAPYRQYFRTDLNTGENAPLSSLDWLLQNINLGSDPPDLWGSWSASEGDPPAVYPPGGALLHGLGTHPSERVAASIQETVEGAVTLLDYDFDYVSRGNNATTTMPVTVRQALEASLSYLYTTVVDERTTETLSRLQALTALSAARDRGLRISYIDTLRGVELAPEGGRLGFDSLPLVSQLSADLLDQAQSRLENGGVPSAPEQLSSSLATLFAMRLALSADHPLIDDFYQSSQGTPQTLLDFLRKHWQFDPALALTEAPGSEGWGLSQWDEWNASESVFITAQLLETLADVREAFGENPRLQTAMDRATEFLNSRYIDLLASSSVAYGDPSVQDPPSSPDANDASVVLTAASLLALHAAEEIDNQSDPSLTEGVKYLKDTIEEDYSWNHRALDTALAMRIIRPDLVIGDVSEPTIETESGWLNYTVNVANDGVATASNFSVGAYRVNPLGLTAEQRVKERLGQSGFAFNLAPEGAETPINVYLEKIADPIYFMVDHFETVVELEEENNLAIVDVDGAPDLSVAPLEFRVGVEVGGVFQPRKIINVEQPWMIRVVVRNLGAAATKSGTGNLTIYLGDVRREATPAVIGESEPLTSLEPNGAFVHEFEFFANDERFAFSNRETLSARIDPGTNDDARSGNNEAFTGVVFQRTAPPDLPDLRIDPDEGVRIRRIGSNSNEFVADVWIENAGAATIANPVVEMTLNNRQPQRRTYEGVLDPHTIGQVTFPFSASPPGVSLQFMVDPDDILEESDEFNNLAGAEVGISTENIYDLAVAPRQHDIRVVWDEETDEWLLQVRVFNEGVGEDADFDGFAMTTPPHLAAVWEPGPLQHDLQSPVAMNMVLQPGEYLDATWIIPDDLIATIQEYHVRVELRGNEDGSSYNDFANLAFVPDGGVNLSVQNLRIEGISTDTGEGIIVDCGQDGLTLDKVTFDVIKLSGNVANDVMAAIYDEETDELLWSHTFPVLTMQTNALQVRNLIRLSEGWHDLKVIVDPLNSIGETDETDNESENAGVRVVYGTDCERLEPDVKFVDGSPAVTVIDDVAYISGFVINERETDDGVDTTPLMAVDVEIEVTLEAPNTPTNDIHDFGAVTIPEMPFGKKIPFLVKTDTLVADNELLYQGTIHLVIDPDDLIEEEPIFGEDNNTYDLVFMQPPAAENVQASAHLGDVVLTWDNGLAIRNGAIPAEDVYYRIQRYINGRLDGGFIRLADRRIVVDQGRLAGETIAYRITTIMVVGGLESESVEVSVATAERPVLSVYQNGDPLPNNKLIVGEVPEDKLIDVVVHAPQAENVDLFFNGTIGELADGANDDFTGNRTLKMGRNVLFAMTRTEAPTENAWLDTPEFRPGNDEAGDEPEDDDWGRLSFGTTEADIEYTTDVVRGRVVHIWKTGSSQARYILGGIGSWNTNPNALPWGLQDHRYLSVWMRSEAGTAISVEGVVRTIDEQQQMTTRRIICSTSGAAGTSGYSTTNGHVFYYLGDSYNDGAWHYIELDLYDIWAMEDTGETILTVDAMMTQGDDYYIDDIAMRGTFYKDGTGMRTVNGPLTAPFYLTYSTGVDLASTPYDIKLEWYWDNPPAPDLQQWWPVSPEFGVAKLPAGTPMRATVRVYNTEVLQSKTFDVEMSWLTIDKNLDGQTELVADIDVQEVAGGLAGGAYVELKYPSGSDFETTTTAFQLPVGEFISGFRVNIDPVGEVVETNEANNVVFVPLRYCPTNSVIAILVDCSKKWGIAASPQFGTNIGFSDALDEIERLLSEEFISSDSNLGASHQICIVSYNGDDDDDNGNGNGSVETYSGQIGDHFIDPNEFGEDGNASWTAIRASLESEQAGSDVTSENDELTEGLEEVAGHLIAEKGTFDSNTHKMIVVFSPNTTANPGKEMRLEQVHDAAVVKHDIYEAFVGDTDNRSAEIYMYRFYSTTDSAEAKQWISGPNSPYNYSTPPEDAWYMRSILSMMDLDVDVVIDPLYASSATGKFVASAHTGGVVWAEENPTDDEASLNANGAGQDLYLRRSPYVETNFQHDYNANWLEGHTQIKIDYDFMRTESYFKNAQGTILIPDNAVMARVWPDRESRAFVLWPYGILPPKWIYAMQPPHWQTVAKPGVTIGMASLTTEPRGHWDRLQQTYDIQVGQSGYRRRFDAYLTHINKDVPLKLGRSFLEGFTNADSSKLENYYAVFVESDIIASTPDPIRRPNDFFLRFVDENFSFPVNGIDFFRGYVCPIDPLPEQDAGARFYTPVLHGEAEPEISEKGFPGGMPPIGASDNVVVYISNEGSKDLHGVELSVEMFVDGQLEETLLTTQALANQVPLPVDGGGSVLRAGLAYPVKVNWLREKHEGASSIELVVSVKAIGDSLAANNNDGVAIPVTAGTESPNLVWDSLYSVRCGETTNTQTIGATPNPELELKWGDDSVITIQTGFVVEDQFLNAATIEVDNDNVEEPSRHEIEIRGITVAGQGAYVNPFVYEHEIAFGDGETPPDHITLDMILDPDDTVVESDETDNTASSIRVDLTYIYQDVAVSGLTVADHGRRESGESWTRVQVAVSRPSTDYLFDSVDVQLYLGQYVDEDSLGSMVAISGQLGGVATAEWDPSDTGSSPQTVAFDVPFELDEGWISVFAAPNPGVLRENPNGGRNNNHAEYYVDLAPNEINLHAGPLTLETGGQPATAINIGQDGTLNFDVDYINTLADSMDGETTATYKVRFWDGNPFDPFSEPIGEQVVIGHEPGLTESLSLSWSPSPIEGLHYLYAEVDPVDHLAAAAVEDRPSTVSLVAGRLWDGVSVVPTLAHQGIVNEAWKIVVQTAADAQSTDLNDVGEWSSLDPAMVQLSTPVVTGPLLVRLEAVDTNSFAGDEALPEIESGDAIYLTFGDPQLSSFLGLDDQSGWDPAANGWVADGDPGTTFSCVYTTDALRGKVMHISTETTGSLAGHAVLNDLVPTTTPVLKQMGVWLKNEEPNGDFEILLHVETTTGTMDLALISTHTLYSTSPLTLQIPGDLNIRLGSQFNSGAWERLVFDVQAALDDLSTGTELVAVTGVEFHGNNLLIDELLLTRSRQDLISGGLGLNTVRVVLPTIPPGQRAVAFWVAEDGSTYYADRLHTLDDPNYGGDEAAVVSMPSSLAMTDGFGMVREDDEIDNLSMAIVDVLDVPSIDLAVTDLQVEPGAHHAGADVDFTVSIDNLLYPHRKSFDLVVSLDNGAVVTTRTLRGAWQRFEQRNEVVTLSTTNLSGNVTVMAEIVINDENSANNDMETTFALAGDYSLLLSDPEPAQVPRGDDIQSTVTCWADPATTGTVNLWVVNEEDERLEQVQNEDLENRWLDSQHLIVPVAWNTGDWPVGEYGLLGELVTNGVVSVRKRTEPFWIVGNHALRLDVRTENNQHYYQPDAETETANVLIVGDLWVPSANDGLATTTTLTIRLFDEAGVSAGDFENPGEGAAYEATVDVPPLMSGESWSIAKLFSGVPVGHYDVIAVADNELADLTVSDSTWFVVGLEDPLGLPAEELVVSDASGVVSRFVHDSQTTLSLRNVSDYTITAEDFMWIDNVNRPLANYNLLLNGDFAIAGASSDEALDWTGGTRAEQGAFWAMELNESDEDEDLELERVLPVLPNRAYRIGLEALWPQTIPETAVPGLTVFVEQYGWREELHIATLSFPIAASDAGSEIYERHEIGFVTAPAVRYVRIRLNWPRPETLLVRQLSMNEGTAIVERNGVSASHRWNLVENPGFVVDSGVDFGRLRLDLDASMDSIAENAVPDGWTAEGDGSVQIVSNDQSLSAELIGLGLETSVDLQTTGAQPLALTQKYLSVDPASTVTLRFWYQGSGEVTIDSYAADQSSIATSSTALSSAGQWTLYEEVASLDGQTSYLGLRLEADASTDGLKLAAIWMGPREPGMAAWSGWIPYQSVVDWNLGAELDDGLRSVHTRYLTHYGALSHARLSSLNAQSAPQAEISAIVEDPEEETVVASLLSDNDPATAISLTDASRVKMEYDLRSPTYVDHIALVGELNEDATLRVLGAHGNGPWFTVAEQALAEGELDLRVALEAVYTEWKIELTAPQGQAVSGELAELVLRGEPVSGDDSVVLDRVAPQIVLAHDGPYYTNATSIAFSGSTTDTLSGIGGIEFGIDDPESGAWHSLQTVTDYRPSVDFSWALDNSNPEALTISEGEHAVVARSYDRAGAYSSPTTVTLIVDYTGPVMTIDEPTSWTWTNGPTAVLWSTADADLATSVGLGLWSTLDGATTASLELADGDEVTSEGLYVVDVYGVDVAGNVGPTTTTMFGLDLTSPTVTLEGEALIAQTATTVDGTAADGADESGLAGVEIRVDGGAWTAADTQDLQAGTYSHAISGLSEGQHTVWARSLDVAGNRSTPVATQIEVDLTGPMMTIDEPTSWTWTNEPTAVLWSTADADLATSVGLGLWSTLDGATTASLELADGDEVTSDGLYVVDVYGVDVAGNVGPTTTTMFGLDLTSPTVTLEGEALIAQTATTVEGTAADGADESGLAGVEVRVDGGTWAAADTQDLQAGTYSHAISGLSEGQHTVWARSLDVAGNRSTPAATPIGVDLTGPVVTIDEPTSWTWTNEPTAVLWSTADADLATSVGLGLWSTLDGATTASLELADGDEVTSEGLYVVDVYGVDVAGNTGPTTTTMFGLDLTSPTVTLDGYASTPTQTLPDDLEIMIVLDRSGSMGTGNPTRISIAKTQIQSLIEEGLEEPYHRVGLVTFNTAANLLAGLSEPSEFPIEDIDSITAANGTEIVDGINLAGAHLLGEDLNPQVDRVRDGAIPIVLLVDDGDASTFRIADLREAADRKAQIVSGGLEPLEIYNLHITDNLGDGWGGGATAMFMRHLSSTFDVNVSLDEEDEVGLFRVSPYTARRTAPVALTDSGGTGVVWTGTGHLRLGPANDAFTAPNYTNFWLEGTTQILVNKDRVPESADSELATFRVDRDSRVAVLWPQNESIPSWLSSGWQVWNQGDRYGYQATLNSYITATNSTFSSGLVAYTAYIRNIDVDEAGAGEASFTLGGGHAGGEDQFYMAFVWGDPAGDGQDPDPYLRQVDDESIGSGFDFFLQSIAKPSLHYFGTADDGEYESGVNRVEIRFDGGDWEETAFNPVTGGFLVDYGDLEDGDYTLEVRAWDRAGNVSIVASLTLTVDSTPPVIDIDAPDEASWHTSSAQMTWSTQATDLATSIGTLTWTAFDSPPTTGTVTVSSGDWATTEGAYNLSVYGIDLVGNVGPTAMRTFGVDLTGPVMTIDEPTSWTWANGPTAVLWSTADADLATSVGLGLWSTLDGATTASLELADVVDVYGVDVAGNVGPTTTTMFGLDLTSPTVTLEGDLTTTNSTPTLSGQAQDGHGSGIEALYWNDNGGAWTLQDQITEDPTTGQPTRVAFALILGLSHGVHTIRTYAVDAAGNASAVTSRTITVDLEAPQIVIDEPDTDDLLSETFLIRADVADDLAGVAVGGVECRIDQSGESWRTMTLTTGTVNSGTYVLMVTSWELTEGEDVLIQVRTRDAWGNDWDRAIDDDNPVEVSVTVDNDYPPAAPTGLVASYVSYLDVMIDWNKNTDHDLSHFKLYRRLQGETELGENQLHDGQILQDATTLTMNRYFDEVTTTTPNYWEYAMKAVDLVGNESLFSEMISVPPPDTPKNLSAIGGDGQVSLAWDVVNEGFIKGYVVFRKAEEESTFSSYTTVLGRYETACVDAATTNGLLFEYYVVALDGSDNRSVPSNKALAVPNETPNLISSTMVMFEDLKNQGNNDWDFNDVGCRISAILEIESDSEGTSCVSRVIMDVEGIFGSAGYSHDLYLTFTDFVGAGTYSVEKWDSTQDPDVDQPFQTLTNQTFDTSVTTASEANITLFLDSKNFEFTGAHAAGINGDRVLITLDVDNPSSNPLTGFDRIPFDAWLHVRNTGQDVHIYDPFSGDGRYYNDVQIVQNDNDLGGVGLNCGLAIPKLDWTFPSDGTKIWVAYPDFIDFVKTYRSIEIKNVNWYEGQ